MDRPITYQMAKALRDKRALCLLAQIDHPNAMFRCWTGIGTLRYNSLDWLGVGILGNITPVQAVNDLSIQEVNFTLSGVNAKALAMLAQPVRNRLSAAWLAAMDKDGSIVRDPFQLVDCEMDTIDFKATPDGTATVTIVARSGFYSLDRASNDVWSDEDQQRRFPGDTGMKYLAVLQNQETIWTPT